jgi:N-acetylmuramoyl-L-alanine amidase
MKWLLIVIFLIAGTRCFAQESTFFRMCKSVGAIPFMEYGMGDDRLGGAKMGYIDSNILLRVVDSVNTDYKVRLSRNHYAYVAKSSCQELPQSVARPYYLSSSIKVFGDSSFDFVTVNMEAKLPYRSSQTINPSGIDVDLFGVTSNTNWITQLSTAKEIGNTWYEQVEDDVLRIHISLKHKQHWGHSIYYDSVSNKLFIRVKRPPPADIRKWKIAIDAGHGGTNIGASGVNSKVLEKDYTLLFAKELEKSLHKSGIRQVFMTREIDTTLDMEERILTLRKENPDVLISLHLNSSASDTVQGASTYYRYIGFRPLSQYIMKSMLELKLKEFGNVGSFNFALSGPTEYPNCLVEIAFLSNPADEKRIIDPKFHKAVAKKISEGLRLWAKEIK